MEKNNVHLDGSSILQSILLSAPIGLTVTVLQLRQDVALLRDQMNNFVAAKEFASFKAIAEQHD